MSAAVVALAAGVFLEAGVIIWLGWKLRRAPPTHNTSEPDPWQWHP